MHMHFLLLVSDKYVEKTKSDNKKICSMVLRDMRPGN